MKQDYIQYVSNIMIPVLAFFLNTTDQLGTRKVLCWFMRTQLPTSIKRAFPLYPLVCLFNIFAWFSLSHQPSYVITSFFIIPVCIKHSFSHTLWDRLQRILILPKIFTPYELTWFLKFSILVMQVPPLRQDLGINASVKMLFDSSGQAWMCYATLGMLALDDQQRAGQLGEIMLMILKDAKDKSASIHLLTHYHQPRMV